MQTDEYLRLRNRIIYGVTRVVLVPEEQIVNEPKPFLPYEIVGYYSFGTSLDPYCQNRTDEDDNVHCETCPMALAGNSCVDGPGSTWAKAQKIWSEHYKPSDLVELKELVDKYNKDLI